MKVYRKIVERPLCELVDDRKMYYQSKIAKAFDIVYKSKNLDYIEQFEQDISMLTTKSLKEDLEGVLLESRKGKIDRRPLLTLYQYTKCRNEGMNNQKIKKKFRMSSPRQIGGFGRWYVARKRVKTLKLTQQE